MGIYNEKGDGSLSGLQKGVWERIPLEQDSCSALNLVYEAAGDTPDDLTTAEVDKYLAEKCVNNLPSKFCNRNAFLNFAKQTIDAYFSKSVLPYSPAQGSPLLNLSDIPSSERKLLARHGFSMKQAQFSAGLDKLHEQHKSRVILGNLDMISHYFTVQGCRDEKDFLRAVENDLDPDRKAMINGYLDMGAQVEHTNDREAVAKHLLLQDFAQSQKFAYDPNMFQDVSQYFYAFTNRGLRTTSALFHSIYPSQYIGSDDFKHYMPKKVKRVLIIGPGLEFINGNVGNVIPRQMYEPFAMADALARNGLVDPSSVRIDLLDVNLDVIKHVQKAKEKAENGQPYRLTLALDKEEEGHDDLKSYFDHFGESLPGTKRNEALRLKSGVLQDVYMPPTIVASLNPIEGDVTTDKFSEDETYDLVLCFNTLVYFSETERVLAGINIARAMKPGAVFLTDNMFVADNGARLDNPVEDTKVQDLFGEDFPLAVTTATVVKTSDKKVGTMVVYRKIPSL